MLIDYHNHTKYCNHASGEMEEYVKTAIEKGIDQFGFSEHFPWMIQEGNDKFALSYDQIPLYINSVKELQQKYKDQIVIKLGAEFDWVPDRFDKVVEFSGKYDFDYIICSIHHLLDWGFDQEEQKELFCVSGDEFKYQGVPFPNKGIHIHLKTMKNTYDIFEFYFNAEIEMLEKASKYFDIIGHIDLIKKFDILPQADIKPLYRKVAQVVKDYDKVVELNTSGIDKPIGEQYPSMDFLKILNELDVPITIGSDAHAPKQVGRHFERAYKILRQIGFKQMATFNQRERIMVDL